MSISVGVCTFPTLLTSCFGGVQRGTLWPTALHARCSGLRSFAVHDSQCMGHETGRASFECLTEKGWAVMGMIP